jgi:CheY-like chemotaxis protein
MRLAEQMMLEGEGYDLDIAVDGEDALAKIQIKQPDLVLMDIMMPRMNGIECCERIKSDPRLKHIKIIMVTTKSEYERVKEAFAAGCDDYVTKPIDKSELITKMRDLLKFVNLRELLRS